ncbi:uncharacterized protein M421DRAFT_74733 [Didymella exigua CBS 183.55]|uniref:Uncharacterized protein n=1 Tax=Didymella exigua CBS 183.55 TaxID=1150837 RepID=A0A6A5R8N9_9PLEO|nr:uncharacterized protein M421DRAFT_74733 [Didymella exigua CBS 183.55]KAF1923699.1 hypothetical protein M421DRAFT_74733 [Didymella exigua CBS 183.55]
MGSLRVPAPTPVSTSTLTNRRSFHMPLSSHGMPKASRTLSPERPHRFSVIGLPNSPADSSPMTPLSPGPTSPPMSANSFGTFIDSAPSTPAYSPRQEGGEWDNSQVTILWSMSSSSLPSSPTEPVWEMMAPVKQPVNIVPATEDRTLARPELPTASSTPLALSRPDILRNEAEIQAKKLVEEEEATARLQDATDKVQPSLSPKTEIAPLGKLATRMKSLLRRSTSEKKKDKKSRSQQEYDRLGDTHWSEM